ncbi:amphi-Trp domain-containing protein [Fundidesulfovibrio putealis]|uniref:amphi-Trp domain-containing protein n=1 Tax=Fundidesulfovibrio putealis TaxID=270496 RepID=UPI000412CC2B|nr:amphi-Trp domain-containing protein [Fundidesulfovibrio putealis]
MSKSSISLKGSMDPQSLAQLLEDMAKSVKAGTVCLQKGGEFVTLKTSGPMDFTIEAAVKKGKQKLEIAVKWEERAEMAAPDEITISAVEPESPPCDPEVVEIIEVVEVPCDVAPFAQENAGTETAAEPLVGEVKEGKKSKKK